VRAKRREFGKSEQTPAALEITSRGKGKGVSADEGTPTSLVEGGRGSDFAQHSSGEEVSRFAPNFTVYVLPPDVVCLYSEDRKFFLHGELYCALAWAIGVGKSFRALVRELEQNFPTDKVHEALQRLLDRRFVVLHSPSFGATAAYWASLGLSPETAERNLRKLRVRIQSIDVKGATELTAALRELGVRVTKRSADINGHLGERLPRRTTGRIESAAFVRSFALATCPTFRHFSASRSSIQTG
jgi:hypothetical protein